MFFLISCDSSFEKGTLQINIQNSLKENSMNSVLKQKIQTSNPALVGDTTLTDIVSLKVCIGDIWISKDEVVAGTIDNLNWVKLTNHTNYEWKYFENYQFEPVLIEAGTYKSIKITSKNLFFRQCLLQNNSSIAYEISDTQSSDLSPCNLTDTTWAQPIFISLNGNFTLNSGVFQLVSRNQKINQFNVNPGQITGLKWSFGDESTLPCTLKIIDKNSNNIWDCGTDSKKIECSDNAFEMFNFEFTYNQ